MFHLQLKKRRAEIDNEFMDDKPEEIEDSDEELRKDIEESFIPVNRHDFSYTIRNLPSETRETFKVEAARIISSYDDSLTRNNNIIKDHQAAIKKLKIDNLRIESSIQRNLDKLKQSLRSGKFSDDIHFNNEIENVDKISLKFDHLDKNGNRFFTISKNQFSFDGKGSNACTCISVICISSFLLGDKEPEELEWLNVLKKGTDIYSSARSLSKSEHQNATEVFKIDELSKEREEISIVNETGGFLDLERDGGDNVKDTFVSFTDAINNADEEYEDKVAMSVTIGCYTFSILVTAKDEWYLYDSHDYIRNVNTSILIKFANKSELCKYVISTYSKVEFKFGTHYTGYSMAIFMKKKNNSVLLENQ
jgi:hypothetical protein